MTADKMIPGRAFRFLYLVLCLWFASRAAAWIMNGEYPHSSSAGTIGMKWRPTPTTQPATIRDMEPPIQKTMPPVAPEPAHLAKRPIAFVQHPPHLAQPAGALARQSAYAQNGDPDRQRGIFNTPLDNGAISAFPALQKPKAASQRWSLSTWLLYRPDNGPAAFANAGQLGGSQAGARIAYDLTPLSSYSLAIHGRMASALQSPAAAEVAVGLSWRPSRALPVALSVERRIAVTDGGRNAFAAYAAGGIGPTPVTAGWELEGYAQAGIVGAARTDGFADGRIALATPLLKGDGARQITAGFAISGGAQPSLTRLDIGPQLAARFPLGGGNARLSIEWRERIAGNARPASGPALTLGADF